MKPLQGTPGGIYGPDGRRLPDSVFFEQKKNTFRARVTPAVGAHRRTIAEACADVASVRQQSAIAKANEKARNVRAWRLFNRPGASCPFLPVLFTLVLNIFYFAA